MSKNKDEKDTEVIEETAKEAIQEETADAPEPEKTDYYDKYLRAVAEFDNYRKRTQKEKDTMYLDGKADCVAAFLPLADNMERCVLAAEASGDIESLKKGIELMIKQFGDILKSLKVEEIPAVGEEFDPQLHNAVMHIEDESCDTNTIVEEFQKGYRICDGKIIRHSMVKVAN